MLLTSFLDCLEVVGYPLVIPVIFLKQLLQIYVKIHSIRIKMHLPKTILIILVSHFNFRPVLNHRVIQAILSCGLKKLAIW